MTLPEAVQADTLEQLLIDAYKRGAMWIRTNNADMFQYLDKAASDYADKITSTAAQADYVQRINSARELSQPEQSVSTAKQSFIDEILAHIFNGDDLSGIELQELALEHNLITGVVFDPDNEDHQALWFASELTAGDVFYETVKPSQPEESGLREQGEIEDLLERLDAGLVYEGEHETDNGLVELFDVDAAQCLFSEAATAIRALLPAAEDGKTYRLLEAGESIEATDEFLEDDAVTWSPVGTCRWTVGCEYNGRFKPMRRPFPTPPAKEAGR